MTLIIDLCGTLILENTTRGFTAWLSSRGRNRLFANIGLSRFSSGFGNVLNVDVARRLQILAMKGLHKSFLYTEAHSYVVDRLAKSANSEVLRAIEQTKQDGYPIYLATASLDPIAYAVTHLLRLDGVVCSRLHYRTDGVCTGRLAEDLLGDKWARLSLLLPRHPQDFILWTDNAEDSDLMAEASRIHFLGDKTKIAASVDPAKFV